MGQVSQLEVEDERRNEAAQLGLLPILPTCRRLRVHTGLETTQRPSPRETPPIRTSRHDHYVRKKANTRNWAANEAWLPHFFDTIVSPSTTSEQEAKNAPVPRRVVVVVERVIHRPFIGEQEIWLKIYKRNDDRLSQRIPNYIDRRVLLAKFSRFFSVCSNEPSTVDCLAEWRGDDWVLVGIFDPCA